MKEFDYTKWDNKPREMWVWDKDGDEKEKQFVVYIADIDKTYPVLVSKAVWYAHCAEIEQTRRMTNYELAHWLWEGTQVGEFREVKLYVGYEVFAYTIINYNANDADKPVDEVVKIRVNGGEWKEPLIEE